VFPYLLITGRRGQHYNSGSMTRRTANATLLAHESVDLSVSDAASLGLADGDLVDVVSRHGRASLPARVTDEVEPGQLFTSFHFSESLVNDVTSGVGDEVTGCPEYKLTAVRLAPGSARTRGEAPH
jgi:formate dehydrogenase major subunit